MQKNNRKRTRCDNPVSINDPLGLADSLPPVAVVVGYVSQKWYQIRSWFNGSNVNYSGSGWGHGPRSFLLNQTGLGKNAENLAELTMQSMLQNNQINLTGSLLNRLKTDPAMIDFQNKIVKALKTDPRFGKFTFVLKNRQIVEFGGKRWKAANENWGALNSSNPALHAETWEVGANPLTWAVRHAAVEYNASVKSDGTAVISYHLSDKLDLTPGGRSNAYDNITSITGFLYHDIAGGNREMQVNADWQTNID